MRAQLQFRGVQILRLHRLARGGDAAAVGGLREQRQHAAEHDGRDLLLLRVLQPLLRQTEAVHHRGEHVLRVIIMRKVSDTVEWIRGGPISGSSTTRSGRRSTVCSSI